MASFTSPPHLRRLAAAEKSRAEAEASAAEIAAVADGLREAFSCLHTETHAAQSGAVSQSSKELRAAQQEVSALKVRLEVSQDALIATCTAAETAEQELRSARSELAAMEAHLKERDAALAAAEEAS